MAAPMKVMASADTCPREQERPEPQGPPGCLEHRGLQELPEATEQPCQTTVCWAGASGCVLASPASLCSCRPLEILTGDLWFESG